MEEMGEGLGARGERGGTGFNESAEHFGDEHAARIEESNCSAVIKSTR
jgi:hypothetical protein